MKYESRPAMPPKRGTESAKLLQARREWYASNPWRPRDWNANAVQQRAASQAMIEAQRTQASHVLTLARESAKQEGNLRRKVA